MVLVSVSAGVMKLIIINDDGIEIKYRQKFLPPEIKSEDAQQWTFSFPCNTKNWQYKVAEQYIRKTNSYVSIIAPERGKSYKLRYVIVEALPKRRLRLNSRDRFEAGWKQLVDENNVKVGNVCVFTKIGDKKIYYCL